MKKNGLKFYYVALGTLIASIIIILVGFALLIINAAPQTQEEAIAKFAGIVSVICGSVPLLGSILYFLINLIKK